MNGRIGSSAGYTCFTQTGNSTVDYLISHAVSQNMIDEFIILPKRVESDHAILTYNINITTEIPHSVHTCTNANSSRVKDHHNILPKKYIWDKRNLQTYLHSFSCAESQKLKSDFICSLSDDIDTVCDKFYSLLRFSLDRSFMQKKSGKNKSTFPKNAWFDDECKHLKRRVNSFAKKKN